MFEKWDETFSSGLLMEDKLETIFHQRGWTTLHRGTDAAYDLALAKPSGKVFLLEVKDESNYAHTGNVCIEMVQGHGKKPSGIRTTNSSVWIHVLGETSVLYRVAEMRLLIAFCRNRLRYTSFKNSDNFTQGYVIPKSLFVGEVWADELSTVEIPNSKLLR